MSDLSVLRLTRNGRAIAEATLGSPERPCDLWVGADEPVAPFVEDVQLCGFEVGGREPDTEYRVWIGDFGSVVSGGAGAARASGVGRGSDIVWDDGRFFDGARGRVCVGLASRPVGEATAWEWRARLPVYVRSSKLSEDRYQSMTAQVRRLASGLLFDLISPMLRSLATKFGTGGVSHRSGLEELRLLERLWQAVSTPLLEIEHDPATRLARAPEPRLSWRGERLGARALARLAADGVDPRHPATTLPLGVINDRLCESNNTPEHCAIAGLLQFAQKRVAGCARDVLSHRHAIEADRGLRDRSGNEGPSLYQVEDRPRIAVLDEALDRADRLGSAIRQARALKVLRGLVPTLQLPSTPVFEHIRPYREIRDQFCRYLRSSLLMLESGAQERVKSTHRLYEQWVFFQIASALRNAGLNCISQEGLFHRSHRYRYTLDVDRGARLSFLARDGRAVVLRYEPWVLPADTARQRRESVYRGRGGETAWSPDVLIEFLDGPAAGPSAGVVDYAVVVDAKYTANLQDHHWSDVVKYQDIRATHNRRQVVKQVWLAYLDPGEAIGFEDTDLSWPDGLDVIAPGEFALGRLGLLPPTELHGGDEEGPRGWIPSPEAVALEFVQHLLKSRGIESGDGGV
jgi:PD-(D/E)XK nuclease superfamily/Domain of unknown function (DUF2357)